MCGKLVNNHLKVISIEQSLVRGNYTFSELCSSRKYPYPQGGPKGGNFRGVGGLLTVAYRGFFRSSE